MLLIVNDIFQFVNKVVKVTISIVGGGVDKLKDCGNMLIIKFKRSHMSTEEFGSQRSLVVVTKEDNPSFLQSEIQLKKLLKQLTSASKEAVDVLVQCLQSPDEKIRLQAAKTIVEFQTATADKVNQDQLQRMIAEIKFNRQPQGRLVPLENDSPTRVRPVVDFNRIQDV